MAASVVYSHFNGRLVHEDRGGVERGYVPDPLGSTVALVDDTGAITDEWTYWPYGEVSSHKGDSATPFTFVGTLGYFKDAVSSLTYVRARFYQAFTGQWMTMDPLWPLQPATTYAASCPVMYSDSSGDQVGIESGQMIGGDGSLSDSPLFCCGDRVRPCMKASSAFGFSKKHDMTNALGHCMTACCIKRRHPECVWYWDLREIGSIFGHDASCMDDWNNKIGYGCSGGKESCYACCLANIRRLSWREPRPQNFPPPNCSGGGGSGGTAGDNGVFPMGGGIVRGGGSPIVD